MKKLSHPISKNERSQPLSMSNFMKLQIKKIEIDKWCEGCRIKADPGQEYVIQWIENHGHWFRNAYNNSCCKDCIHWSQCGFKVLDQCEHFVKAS